MHMQVTSLVSTIIPRRQEILKLNRIIIITVMGLTAPRDTEAESNHNNNNNGPDRP